MTEQHTYADEQAGAQEEGPVSLPYAGTSGHSGTDTSRERAERADSSGKTNERQRAVLRGIAAARTTGVTVKDIREVTGWHHGVASSVLTTLHIAGRIVRLEEKRDRCHVYVFEAHRGDRAISPYVPNVRNRPTGYTQTQVDQIEEDAFARGMQAATEEPSYAWATEAAHDADKVLAKIDEYLTDRESIPTSVAWIKDIRKIMKGEKVDG